MRQLLFGVFGWLFCLGLLSSHAAWGQTVVLGVGLGPNRSNDSELGEAGTGRWGLTAYSRVTVHATAHVAFEIGAQYTQKGTGEYLTVGLPPTYLRLTYIELPVLATGRVRVADGTHLMAGVGLAPSFNVKAMLGTFDIGRQIRDRDLSAVVGIGAIKDVKWGVLELDVRYFAGLESYVESLINPQNVSPKNRSLVMTAGVGFRLWGGG